MGSNYQIGVDTSSYTTMGMSMPQYANAILNQAYSDGFYYPNGSHSNMSLSSIAKRLLDADTKVLIKAGYMHSDLSLTEKGLKSLTSIVFEQNKAAVVAEAQADLDEAAKK